jgi:hypothetical protein
MHPNNNILQKRTYHGRMGNGQKLSRPKMGDLCFNVVLYIFILFKNSVVFLRLFQYFILLFYYTVLLLYLFMHVLKLPYTYFYVWLCSLLYLFLHGDKTMLSETKLHTCTECLEFHILLVSAETHVGSSVTLINCERADLISRE